MKHWVKHVIETEKDGQTWKYRCVKCNKDLSRVFYTWGTAYQVLGVWDCVHYEWIFIGDYDLSPPWDENTRRIIENSLGKVSTNGGKYFLLPK